MPKSIYLGAEMLRRCSFNYKINGNPEATIGRITLFLTKRRSLFTEPEYYSGTRRRIEPANVSLDRRRQIANNPRLLNVDTFKLSTPPTARQNSTLKYAVLSHTWREEGNEVSLQDLLTQKLQDLQTKDAFAKLQFTNDQAKRDGLDFFWVDTCCIDKTSSAELSEAINSMYPWYANASVCYVYIADYDSSDETSMFGWSRWFERAWTLQELLAPKEVRFFDKNWVFLGLLSDRDVAEVISRITRIDAGMLLHERKLSDFSIAQRMSWAARRQATRLEDRAYSLLGIFDVNMPMLYGEGTKAFRRLQEEIMKVSTDHSIFCWKRTMDVHGDDEVFEDESVQDDFYSNDRTLLAPSPSFFAESSNIVPRLDSSPRPYSMTNRGLEITLPVRSYYGGHIDSKLTCAKLNCFDEKKPDETILLNLHRQYDLDTEESDGFKSWLRPYQRRFREAWDDLMGRDFDWQFVDAFARRGFAVGHPGKSARMRLDTIKESEGSEKAFREQTIVVMREAPTDDTMPKVRSVRTANPLANFNELLWVGGLGLHVSIIVLILGLTAYTHGLLSEHLDGDVRMEDGEVAERQIDDGR